MGAHSRKRKPVRQLADRESTLLAIAGAVICAVAVAAVIVIAYWVVLNV